MKIAIVYYSYSGNTDKAAKTVAQLLQAKNHDVERLRLEAPGESDNFFVQCLRAAIRRKVEIAPVKTDLSGYDLVMLATPVWASQMVPAMRKFLEQASGLSAKPAAVFATYHSGLGKEQCLNSLEQALKRKGARSVCRFAISQYKVEDKQLIDKLLRACLP